MGSVTCCVLAVPTLKLVSNSHVMVFCSIPLLFSKSEILRTVNGAAPKEYVVYSIAGSSRRGWLTWSAISREIDCKRRIFRNALSHSINIITEVIRNIIMQGLAGEFKSRSHNRSQSHRIFN